MLEFFMCFFGSLSKASGVEVVARMCMASVSLACEGKPTEGVNQMQQDETIRVLVMLTASAEDLDA
eukprot:4893933-Amphidinium_carterae.1